MKYVVDMHSIIAKFVRSRRIFIHVHYKAITHDTCARHSEECRGQFKNCQVNVKSPNLRHICNHVSQVGTGNSVCSPCSITLACLCE